LRCLSNERAGLFNAVYRPRAREGQQQRAFGDVESGLVFIGLIGLIDPPRPEAVDAIRQCAAAGMSVKMITGDHAATATAASNIPTTSPRPSRRAPTSS
jgi:P-type E1-E2 ATPase